MLRSFLLISLAALVQVGCRLGCTEIGCESGVLFTFSRGLVEGDHQLVISSEGLTSTCEIHHEPGGFLQSCEGDFPMVRATNDDLFVSGEFEEMSLVLTEPGGEERAQSFELSYEKSRPNGPGCSPVCKNANAEFFLD